ncbi:hypothetical protein BHM03_00017526 [Ensete ventricosum]|nr:hypothetical protein BHM03_00017526 [Ensete ventricosum]
MKEIVVGSDVGRRGTPSPPPPPPQALLERLKDYGQEDAFAFWDELSPEERSLLVKDIEVQQTWVMLTSSLLHLNLTADYGLLPSATIIKDPTAYIAL